jgi:hypothetical protein
MTNNSTGRRNLMPLVWQAARFVALALAAVGLGVFWLRSADGRAWPAFAAAAGFALTGVVATVWLARARAARRWSAAVNAYAEREIARELGRKARRKVGRGRRRRSVLQRPRTPRITPSTAP